MYQSKSKYNVLFLLVFITFGALLGFLGSSYVKNTNFSLSATSAYLVCILFICSFICIVIHETGHLVMGLLTGYDFVSIRFASFVIVRENSRLSLRRYKMLGTGGQCLMTYKSTGNLNDIPYFWYHFGGVFFNLLTAIICIPILIVSQNTFVTLGFITLAGISFIFALMNLIPNSNAIVRNDGSNLLLMRKDPAFKTAIYKSLAISALLHSGTRLTDIPDELLYPTEEEKLSKMGDFFMALDGDIALHSYDFETAREKYRLVAENKEASGLYQRECKCEMVFCMIMTGSPKDEIDCAFDSGLRQYIKTMSGFSISKIRFLYAYYIGVEKDTSKAEKVYETAVKMQKKYPIKGEYIFEIELIEYIKRLFSPKESHTLS